MSARAGGSDASGTPPRARSHEDGRTGTARARAGRLEAARGIGREGSPSVPFGSLRNVVPVLPPSPFVVEPRLLRPSPARQRPCTENGTITVRGPSRGTPESSRSRVDEAMRDGTGAMASGPVRQRQTPPAPAGMAIRSGPSPVRPSPTDPSAAGPSAAGPSAAGPSAASPFAPRPLWRSIRRAASSSGAPPFPARTEGSASTAA